MNNDFVLILPEVPKVLEPTEYNYYVSLHQNLKRLEAEINRIRTELHKQGGA